MAQSMAALPEQVFVECRALVFCYDVQLNRWSDVGEQNVYSRIQLIGSRSHGSAGKYRVFGRLESTGAVRCIATRFIFNLSLSKLQIFFKSEFSLNEDLIYLNRSKRSYISPFVYHFKAFSYTFFRTSISYKLCIN